MIATLPVCTGPVYVFLAIDHGAQFISDSARMSVAAVTATIAFVAAHALVARRSSTLVSVVVATLAWFAVALLLQLREWRFIEACLLFAASLAWAIGGLRHFVVEFRIPPIARVRYDLALRAALVACVVIGTSVAADALGPAAAGVLATYPVVLTSLILILQPRYGGAFTAAMLVNALKGIVGYGVALGVLHLAAASMNSAWALLIALGVAVGWNGALFMSRRARRVAGSDAQVR